jgi:hypothetical protein
MINNEKRTGPSALSVIFISHPFYETASVVFRGVKIPMAAERDTLKP